MPERLRSAAEGLSAEQLRRRAVDGAFSLVEHVCHLRDLEREGYRVRIERILAEDRPELPDFDGARIARERSYHTERFERALADFEEVRRRNLALVSDLSPDELARVGVLEPSDEVTVDGLLTRMCAHDAEHDAQISELLRLLKAS